MIHAKHLYSPNVTKTVGNQWELVKAAMFVVYKTDTQQLFTGLHLLHLRWTSIFKHRFSEMGIQSDGMNAKTLDSVVAVHSEWNE